MKRFFYLLGLVGAIMTGLYGLVWYMASRQAIATVDQFVAEAEQAGWAVKLGERPATSGFPGTLRVAMGTVLAQRDHDTGEVTTLTLTPVGVLVPWEADRLQIQFSDLSYRIDDAEDGAILVARSDAGEAILRQDAQTGGQDWAVTAWKILFSDRSSGRPDLAPSLSADQARLSIDRTPSSEEAVERSSLALSMKTVRTQRHDLQRWFSGRRGDLNIKFSMTSLSKILGDLQDLRLREEPPSPEQVLRVMSDWRDAGGQIDLERFNLMVTPSRMSAMAQAALDPDGEIRAEGRVEIEGVIQFLAEPAAIDLLGPGEVLTAQLLAAGLLEDFGDGRHGIPLDLTVADGEARLGAVIRQPVPSAAEIAAEIARRVGRDWENFRLIPAKNPLGD